MHLNLVSDLNSHPTLHVMPFRFFVGISEDMTIHVRPDDSARGYIQMQMPFLLENLQGNIRHKSTSQSNYTISSAKRGVTACLSDYKRLFWRRLMNGTLWCDFIRIRPRRISLRWSSWVIFWFHLITYSLTFYFRHYTFLGAGWWAKCLVPSTLHNAINCCREAGDLAPLEPNMSVGQYWLLSHNNGTVLNMEIVVKKGSCHE